MFAFKALFRQGITGKGHYPGLAVFVRFLAALCALNTDPGSSVPGSASSAFFHSFCMWRTFFRRSLGIALLGHEKFVPQLLKRVTYMIALSGRKTWLLAFPERPTSSSSAISSQMCYNDLADIGC